MIYSNKKFKKKCQRFAWKSKEYIKIFIEVLFHHKAKQNWNRMLNIVHGFLYKEPLLMEPTLVSLLDGTLFLLISGEFSPPRWLLTPFYYILQIDQDQNTQKITSPFNKKFTSLNHLLSALLFYWKSAEMHICVY